MVAFSEKKYYSVIVVICDLYVVCESYQILNTWNDGRIRVKSSMFTKSTQASIRDRSDYKVLRLLNLIIG